MSKYDTLKYEGHEKTLAARGVSLNGATGDFTNQRADVLRLVIPGGSPSDAELFTFEGAVVFYTQRDSTTGNTDSFSGGTIEFQGKRVGEVIDLRPQYEGVAYEFHGPWYDLEQSTYQQPFGSWQTGSLTFPFQSELLLFSRINTGTGVQTFISNGDQITDILQFLLDQYSDQGMTAPYQLGTCDPALELPVLPCKPMSCAAAIEKCLELSPDCTVSFDYTTTPPTINVASCLVGASTTLAIGNGTDHKSLRIVPRPDLRPRAVIVIFKITTTVDGTTYISFAKQKEGPNGSDNVLDPDSGLRVIVDWIDLLGPSSTSIKQSIIATAIDANAGTQAARRAWWALHDKQFSDLRTRMQDSGGSATNFPTPTVVDAETGATVSLTDYPNELVDGTIHPWMGFNVKRVKISIVVTYAVYDAVGASETATTGKLIRRFTQKEHHVEITVTNATTDTYSTTETSISGEDVPTGLASGIFESLDRMQYEGDYVKVQAAINGGITMPSTLNLTGGRTEWETMNAQIQSIHKDYGRGETTVNIGPAKHLNADQLMYIFRAWRFRFVYYNPAVRASGAPGDTGAGTEISKNAPKKNTMEGLENPSAQLIRYFASDDPTSTLKGTTNIDAKDIDTIYTAASSPAAVTPFGTADVKEVKHRKVSVCLPDGTKASMIVLAGAPFTES
jgi:hypothetical protein